jgi:hypothetical protein
MTKKTRKLAVLGAVAVGAYFVGRKLFARGGVMAGLGIDTSGVVVGSSSAPSTIAVPKPQPIAVVGGTNYGQSPFGPSVSILAAPTSKLAKYLPAALGIGLGGAILYMLLRSRKSAQQSVTV